MRIGDSAPIPWSGGGVAGAKGKGKLGAKGTIPKDPALAALDDYETYQRQAFEAGWWDEDPAWLRSRLADAKLELVRAVEDGVRRRRILAEIWAIDRLLAKGGNLGD